MGHPRKPKVLEALLAMLVLVASISSAIVFYETDPHIAMLLGVAAAAIVGLRCGHRWQTIQEGMVAGIANSLQAVIILMIIGVLIGLWIVSGVVPTLLYYGLMILQPEFFLPAALLICAVTSLATGTSWGTTGTIGVALMGIGAGLGFPLPIVAGACLSGAYFGDKMSPLSDTTNLAPAMVGTDLYTHIRHMMYTTGVAFGLTLVIEIVLGFQYGGSEADAVQVACFDTAFHRGHPFVNDTFALPRRFYEKGVRRYGFHGLSYDYISGDLARRLPEATRVVVAHLGNGASMCALRDGRSVASTMGFSALDGLPMGTRSGQLDPGVVLYLMEQEGMTAEEISDLLYKESGLKGMSGISNDMRELEASDDPRAAEAIDYFTFRIRRELGALAAVLGGLDAVVFCGGIGENSAMIRHRVCDGMGWLGITLDAAANRENAPVISSGAVRVMVIPTDEEIVIARAAMALSPLSPIPS